MSRKHRRQAHVPLDEAASRSLYVVPRSVPETPEQYNERKFAELRQRDDAALRAMKQCAWPYCNTEPRRGPGGPSPLCTMHTIRVTTNLRDALDAQPALTEWKLNRELEAHRRAEQEERDRESRSIAPGWVYYLRVDERIKIGFTTDVRQRMRSYPPHSELLAVHPGTMTLERQMHAQFAGHLAQGREWFRPDAPVMAHITKVLEDFGPPPAKFVYRFRDGTRQQIKIHKRSRR